MPDYLSNPEDSSNGPSLQNQAPAYGDPGQPVAPPSPDPAAPKPSVWGNVLRGALQGLTMNGIPGAIAGAVHPDQTKQIVDNRRAMADAQVQEAKSQIRFRDAQAGASLAEAAVNNFRAAALPQEAKDAHNNQQRTSLAWWLQHGGTVDAITGDTHEDALAGIQSISAGQPDGKMPGILHFYVDGQNIAINTSNVSGTPAGLRSVNEWRQVNNLPSLTPAQWSQTGKTVQNHWTQEAEKFWNPPAPSNADVAESTRLQYQSKLDALKKSKADPDLVSRMQALQDELNTQSSGMSKHEKGKKAADAYANAAAQKQARLDVDQKAYQEQLASGDVTGWKPRPGAILSEQQFNAANTKFVSGALAKAQDTEKSYEMFNEAYDQRKDAKSGAQSMLALSQHLATTFGTVKGARVTKDMIEHHLGARNISDSAQVAAQKLVNGDVLSENQWNGFRELITNARRQTWNNTVKQAHSLGVPVTADMLPKQKGRP